MPGRPPANARLNRLTGYLTAFFMACAIAGACPVSAQESASAASFMPYYASFRSDEVNMRVGPSKDHPIAWVYHRKGLPVQVIDRHNEWRQVVAPDGDRGWVKKSLLSPRRTVFTLARMAALRSNPSVGASAIAQVEQGVVCPLRSCNQHWCQVDAGAYRGWLEKDVIWGVDRSERFE